ncbi:MAG: SDR family NAD(P)-dependent oxidoreductase [Mycobacteriaceae bacterium]|nr:SDR family NAD(P)-dependent oxidoreductase [Mycobacteriaceae bacterium]
MRIENGTVLITGANRGIGLALVQEALRRGAAQVYAGVRAPWSHPDPRVVPLILDVTDRQQIGRAAGRVSELDVLVNTAGIAVYDDLTDRDVIDRHLAVNLYGIHDVTTAFRPHLIRSKGAVVNNLSLNSLAPLPVIPAYGISKAAAFSLTQSLRAQLSAHRVSVHAILTGPTDTDMNRGFDIPKATTESVARAIFDGAERGDEEIFPDPWSESLAADWLGGAVKTLERQLAEGAGEPDPNVTVTG